MFKSFIFIMSITLSLPFLAAQTLAGQKNIDLSLSTFEAINHLLHKSLRRQYLRMATMDNSDANREVAMIKDAYELLQSEDGLIDDIRESLLDFDTVTIYDCSGGNIAILVGGAIGGCNGYEFHADGVLRMKYYAQISVATMLGMRASSYDDLELIQGGKLAGVFSEINIGPELIIGKKVGLDIIDLEIGTKGNTDSLFDFNTGLGYGASLLEFESALNIPWGRLVEVSLANDLLGQGQ